MKSVLGVSLLLLASAAWAQDAPTPDWFKKLDRDGDGKISREEMPKRFDQIDTDKDGIGTLAEVTAYFSKEQATAPAPAKPQGEQTTAAPTPDDIEMRAVVIYCDGTKMAGDVYLPKTRQPGQKLPGIVFCAGTGGTKKGLPTRLGPILARAGFVCLGFDYRGWGESDPLLLLTSPVPAPDEKGEVTVKAKPVRWQMNLDDQTRDIRSAISFLQGQPEVDPERIGLFGSSYGGGLVTLMAAIDPRVKCAAAQVAGLGTGPQRDKAGYDLLGKQARGEVEPVPLETGKLGGKMARYENMRSNPAKSIGYPDKYELVGRIRIPMIFIDAENEELSDPKENGEKFANILRGNGVPVKYHVIKGISHYGIYREGFQEASDLELAWFKEHLLGEAKPKPQAAAPAPTDTDLAFFETHIRPVLIKSCYECHSSKAKELKAGLALDGRAALLKGGDSGAVVVPGKPEESLLIASLRYDDPDLQMPPEKHGGQLSEVVLTNFTEWVKRGAPMPEGKTAGVEEKMEARLAHWAFQPVKDSPAPPVKNAAWPRNDVDRFVLAELEKKGLAPVADADPLALLRRVYLDLTGLPPTAEQVQALVANPTDFLEQTISHLLESPQFGERWGRHWLDVARYAESSGKETDFAYPQAWRYRDYVIQAFNQDKTFDQFIREQIAGDLLPAADEKRRAELLIATGFLAIGPKSHIEKNPLQFEMDVVDEQIDTVTQAFLGLTAACARCHDHKYDPVSQRDYYAMAGITPPSSPCRR